jgi:hypothetical protein
MRHIESNRQRSKPSAGSRSIIERLFADAAWTANYRVTAEERESLSNVAMMGELKSERDVLFILNQLRHARLRW